MTQITETDETNAENVSDTPTAPIVDVEALTDAIAEAELAQEEAESKFKAAGVAGELDDMMAAADANKVAIKAVAKAKTVYASATYELRNEERMVMSIELKAAIEMVLDEFDVSTAVGLGLQGASIRFDAESGTYTTEVNAAKPSGGKGKGKGSGNGGTKARIEWLYEGTIYASAELLERFGGQKGLDSIDKARNFANYTNTAGETLKFSPGFNQPVKALGKAMGWNGDNDNRQLTHLPTDW